MSTALPFAAARSRTLEWLIIRAVPLLNRVRPCARWHHTLGQLRALPPASWGATLAQFLAARGFEDFLPNYQAHDAFHALLGYETDVEGELRLQAFMVGNGSASIAGRVLFVLSWMLLPELWPQLRRDIRRGRASTHVGAWDVPALLQHDIDALRASIVAL